MVATWPHSLVDELANRRCIIFLGAGATAGCNSADGGHVRPPTWIELLENLKNQMYSEADKPVVDDLIRREKFLDAAEVILSKIHSAEFAGMMRRTFSVPRFEHSPIHEAVLQIDPKIVITTNYDQIYDTYCQQGEASDGYRVCKYYDSGLVASLRSPVRLILKAHGCISEPEKMVLTRSQYFKERQDCASFYKILDSLFLTNTLFFVGYSVSDPDIQLILENVNISVESAHPHYAYVPSGMHEIFKASLKRSYNIEFLEYPTGNYDEVNASLKNLSEQVTQFRAINST